MNFFDLLQNLTFCGDAFECMLKNTNMSKLQDKCAAFLKKHKTVAIIGEGEVLTICRVDHLVGQLSFRRDIQLWTFPTGEFVSWKDGALLAGSGERQEVSFLNNKIVWDGEEFDPYDDQMQVEFDFLDVLYVYIAAVDGTLSIMPMDVEVDQGRYSETRVGKSLLKFNVQACGDDFYRCDALEKYFFWVPRSQLNVLRTKVSDVTDLKIATDSMDHPMEVVYEATKRKCEVN